MNSNDLFNNLDNVYAPFNSGISQADCYLIKFGQLDFLSQERYLKLLSSYEYQACVAIHNERARFQYIFSRATLKHILGNYLQETPEILVGKHGKPYLQNGEIHFNLSHSANWLLIGISNLYPIGVDIEEIKSISEWRDIEEIDRNRFGLSINQLQKSSNIVEFYQRWTQKEAFLKALGLGIVSDVKITKNLEESGYTAYEKIVDSSFCISVIVLNKAVKINFFIMDGN